MTSVFYLIFMLSLPIYANAYIDPGAGIIVWQGLIAAVGAILFAVRKPRQIFKMFFRKLTGKDSGTNKDSKDSNS